MTHQRVFYVAVHGGAGQHGKTSEAQVKGAMKHACAEALQVASEHPCASALSIVEHAITILEDDDALNAGYGSNLTFEGTVECDAAIMDGRTGDFGSVGAVSGVRHPIKLASAILGHARVPDRLGRIRPLTLVSSGAHAFAQRHGIETVDDVTPMIAPRAQQDWQRWRKRYDDLEGVTVGEAHGADTDATDLPQDAMQDTVGAVVWDSEGNLAAGVSRSAAIVRVGFLDTTWLTCVYSGGLLLKYSGRIGEAAAFGAGCWAEQSQDGRTGMACSISGAGEHIMRTGLARTIADVLRPRQVNAEVDVHELLINTLSTHFHGKSGRLNLYPIVARSDTHPNLGVLLMTKEAEESGNVIPRLWCAFTTQSMAIAYANSETLTPKAKILRRPKTSQPDLATNASPVYITALPLHE
ncbi:nucleophile aminohydrolase [Boletus edulis BED1]|uniref:Nucleophile aminohydrolase n=1 Tax=Boletus edulis BED1 TaxID=1328754 RepID=A0AAD4BW42_BOLED|nr:nucleophile aminohydrolase [Boletus edulis BED1]